jgi:2'-5' RNA ligase
MYAIVSLLEDSAYQLVEGIWNKLEIDCGLAGIKVTPYPHFSWQLAENYDLSNLKVALQDIASVSTPMKVLCAGLGIFTGPEPVIYIQVVKDDHLLKYHRELWGKIMPLAISPSTHYAPNTWVPHITLAHSDVDSEKLACALKDLATQPLSWELKIDNLSLVYQTGEEVGQLEKRFDFLEEGSVLE